ncbi:MAG: redox-regulated ATPase YchF [Clostridia bacterium]|nr:redox-regulated ATPase YchF [Clostridia bacterium]
MEIGIVGLPNVGKSTMFNAITKAGAECANYPFCTIEPNVGIVPVPDDRLDRLSDMYHPAKTTHAIVKFVDIAGLVKGASKGEGLGNKFLSHIREVDAIVQVVRCFENSNIVHVDGSIDPIRDVETINLELIFADLEAVDKRREKAIKLARTDKKNQVQVDALDKLRAALMDGKLASTVTLTDEEKESINDLWLLTSKPMMYVANISEEQLKDAENDPNVLKLKEYAQNHGSKVIPLCVKVEEELASLDDDEKDEMLALYGIEKSGLDRLITESYDLLGLISFLTSGEDECRAWTITKGTKAPQAAGKIHTDFERGFIKAEVIGYQELLDCGSSAKAKEKGLIRIEGKDYVVQDGDVILFRFNV